MQFALVLYPKIESGMNTQHLKWHFSLISCFFLHIFLSSVGVMVFYVCTVHLKQFIECLFNKC